MRWVALSGFAIAPILRAGHELPPGAIREDIRLALSWHEAVSSGTWEDRARKAILEDLGEADQGDFPWTLAIRMERCPAWLESIPRKRLDGEWKKAQRITWRPFHEVMSGRLDDALLALAEVGAALEDRETGYLRRFGYCCEPRKYLIEMLQPNGRGPHP